jgi:UDP-N-acetyl-D-glucosamine dehydrogenase
MLLAPDGPAVAIAAALTNELAVRYARLGLGPADLPAADPTDPSWVARLIDLAGEVSTAAPAAVVGRVADALNFAGKPVNGSRVLLIGLGGKGVDAAGPFVLERLMQKGARVGYHEPAVPTLPPFRQYPRVALASRPLSVETLAGVDAVVILTDLPPADAARVRQHALLVVDARESAAV